MTSRFREEMVKNLHGRRYKKESLLYTEAAVEQIVTSSFETKVNVLEKYRKFIDRIFGLALSVSEKKYWVEKTPDTMLIADFLYMVLPNMKYVHIFREPKDV